VLAARAFGDRRLEETMGMILRSGGLVRGPYNLITNKGEVEAVLMRACEDESVDNEHNHTSKGGRFDGRYNRERRDT
jgi:hypothetical protein